MFGSSSKPLGWGKLGELLNRELEIGKQASVLDTEHVHPGYIPGGHIDARLYEKLPDGRIREVPGSRVHLDPKTLNKIK
jgi:hypothetical protein